MKYKAEYIHNPELPFEKREFHNLKDAGHFYFDKIWQSGNLTREEAEKALKLFNDELIELKMWEW